MLHRSTNSNTTSEVSNPDRKPYWRGYKTLLDEMKVSALPFTDFSINFDNTDKTDMGLKFSTILYFLLLQIGVILAIFKVLGKVPSDIEELNKLHISGARKADSFLWIKIGIIFILLALLCKDMTSFSISMWVACVRKKDLLLAGGM